MFDFEARKILKTPEDFAFPYTPYPMQQELMRSLYKVLEDKGVGIFESPTGTGKSLTLTCAALHWLEDHENLVRDDLLERISEIEHEINKLEMEEAKTNDWINVQHATNERRNELRELFQFREHLEERKNHLAAMRARRMQQKKNNKRGRIENITKIQPTLDPANVESEEEDSSEEEDMANVEENDTKENKKYKEVQIFFCSRTHTQLTQVLHEVKRTAYGSRVRCVTLASRQQLCIHPQVRNLASLSAINERCLDMTRNKNKPLAQVDKKQKKQQVEKCPFKAPSIVDDLTAAVLTDVLDIEELVNEAGLQQACPYYATRAAAADAQLVFLSYQMLLHKRTRETCGIDVRGSIIIIDEGHNLLDTIADMNSCTCTLLQMRSSVSQLKAYKKKHLKRFSAANLLKINQLLYVIHRLEAAFSLKNGKDQETRVYETYQLMSDTDIFDIDLFKLLAFCEQRHLAQKLQNYKFEVNKIENPVNTIRPVLAFLEALTENAKDGRVLMNIDVPEKSYYKYISLNPARHFEEIVSNARAIIVAGGTMQPTTELRTQLFASNPERIREHFYDHVVPTNAVKCFIVTHGPNKTQLHFNFNNRKDATLLYELGSILSHLCNVIPAGLVVFFPSYEFLKTATEIFNRSQKFSWNNKIILQEVQDSRQSTVDLLMQYKMLVKSSKGAVLMAVVGGKLSEGLDFKDDLGRGVVVVGMPYPYRNSPELKQRMEYLDKQLGAESGEIYYENLCLKAINQCIGRAVRHINDYACVYLLDKRYSQLRIQNKLPQWIRRSIQVTDSIDTLVKDTSQFFAHK